MMNCIEKPVAFFFVLFAMSLSGWGGEAGEAVARLGGRVLLRDALSGGERQAGGKEACPPSEAMPSDVAMLTAWVLDVRKAEAMERLGIVVSDEEVEAAVRKAIGDGEEYIRRNNEVLRRLPRALRKAREAPDRTEEIYEEELRGYMSHALWLRHVAKNYSEEEIAFFERHAPMDAGELDNLANAVRRSLMERKLCDAVCGTGESVAGRDQLWEAWCRRQVLEAPVVIEDPALQAEYELRLPSVGRVFLPPGNRTDWPEPSVPGE